MLLMIVSVLSKMYLRGTLDFGCLPVLFKESKLFVTQYDFSK